MTQTVVKISAQSRPEGKNPRQIRAEGLLPITIYGKGMESMSLAINSHEFMLLNKDNKDAAWEIDAQGKKINAQIQELQMNYRTNEMLNVEFKAI